MNRIRCARQGLCYPGFTLIEAMLVLAILGLLLGIGMPSMSDFLARMRATSQAYLLHSSFRFARAEAVKTGRELTLCGTDDGRHCSRRWLKQLVVFEDMDKNTVADEAEIIRIIDLKPGPGSFTMGTGTNQNHVRLKHNGSVSFTGSLTYCNLGYLHHSRQITFNRPGRTYQGILEVKEGRLINRHGTLVKCD